MFRLVASGLRSLAVPKSGTASVQTFMCWHMSAAPTRIIFLNYEPVMAMPYIGHIRGMIPVTFKLHQMLCVSQMEMAQKGIYYCPVKFGNKWLRAGDPSVQDFARNLSSLEPS